MSFKEVQCNFKTVLKHLRRVHLVYCGAELSPSDRKQFLFVMELWYHLIHDVPGLHPSTLTRQMCVLFSAPDLDVIEMGKGLDEIVTRIRLIADDVYHPSSYDRFKADVGHYARIILSMIRDDVCDYISIPTPARYKALNQCFSFPRKMLLRDIDNTDQLESEYVATEKRVESAPHSYSPSLRKVVEGWALTPDYDQFLPKHGPGRTAESSDTSSKWKFSNFKVDDRLLFFYRHHNLDLKDFLPTDCVPSLDLERTSQTIFVPKTLKTKRVISAEPVAIQYTQQGLMRVILEAVDRSPLGAHIDLEHQELSRDFAKEASIDGLYATIDYSSASDSVSWRAVKEIFPTWLLLDLYCTKTDNTKLPSGIVLSNLAKLSPMGSAVCFPVECLVFSAMAELACHLCHITPVYRVYGDDVILPAVAVPTLIKISTDMGFQLNDLKSYFNQGITSYREACGIEAMNGQDVTPVNVSRQFYLPEELTPATTEIFDLLQTFYNNLRLGGFRFSARLIFKLTSDLLSANANKSLSMKNVLFDLDGTRGFITEYPTEVNWHLASRFRLISRSDDRSCFQLPEKRCLAVSNKVCFRPEGEQQIAYFEWLLKAYLRQKKQKQRDHVYRVATAGFIHPDCVIKTNVVGRDFKLKLRWVYA